MTTSEAAAPRSTRADAWLVAAGAVAATWAITELAPRSLEGDPTVPVVTQVLLALAVGAGAFVVSRRYSPTATGALVALLTGLFLCGGATALLNSTPFGPLGAVADQSYRTAYLTKFGHTWHLVDYAYKGLPSFYPPLYFWVLGRLGAVLGIASWEMLKIGMLAVAFLVPTGGWLLWRPVVGPRRAAVVVVATSLVFHEWYVPQLWLAIAVFVPWWLYFVVGVGRPPGKRLGTGGLAVGILVGAIVALTYWYILLIGLVHLGAMTATRRAARRRGRDPEPSSLRDVAIVLGGIVVVTLPYWLPLAVSFLTTPGARTMQNRYYTAEEVSLPLPFATFDLKGAVLAFGLVALVVTAHRRRVALHLLGLLAAAYALYLVGYLAFLADNPIDTLRTTGVIEVLLAAGAGLGAADLWRIATTTDVGARVGRTVDRRAAIALLAVAGVVVVFALGQTAVRDMPFLAEQRAATYPDALIDGFTRATGGDYEDAVVLTDETDLSSFLPTYVFNTSNAHYSHPAARFEDRAALLTTLSRESDPEAFALAFLHNRYDDIDFVALHPDGDGRLSYDWLDDAFPRGVAARSISFSPDSFATDAFEALPSRGTGLELYRVRRSEDPLRSLRSCPANPDREACAVLGTLLDRYSSHLDDETKALARRWRGAAG